MHAGNTDTRGLPCCTIFSVVSFRFAQARAQGIVISSLPVTGKFSCSTLAGPGREKTKESENPGVRLKTFLENVGLVRFELTIDGSLRHASVLQRVIIESRETTKGYKRDCPAKTGHELSRPIVHHLQHKNAKTAGARRHSGLGHNPSRLHEECFLFADPVKSQSGNLRVLFAPVSRVSQVYGHRLMVNIRDHRKIAAGTNPKKFPGAPVHEPRSLHEKPAGTIPEAQKIFALHHLFPDSGFQASRIGNVHHVPGRSLSIYCHVVQ